MLIVGIDPGNKGGLAVMNPDTLSVSVRSLLTVTYKTSSKGKKREELDVSYFANYMRTLCEAEIPTLAVVEYPPIIPTNGSLALTSLFRNFGVVIGVLTTLRVPLETPSPQTWKSSILKGTRRDKIAAITYVRYRHPSVDIRNPNKPNEFLDGHADAICLAEYGRRLLRGQQSDVPAQDTGGNSP